MSLFASTAGAPLPVADGEGEPVAFVAAVMTSEAIVVLAAVLSSFAC